MKILRHIFLIFILILSHCFSFYPVIADEEEYLLVDYGNQQNQIASYSSFTQAKRAFGQEKANYNNLTIVFQGEVLASEYAIVLFHHTDACDYNVEFIYENTGTQGYTNGCYGIDGAYLETSSDGSKVRFLLSGADGWANKEDVTIIPIEVIPSRISAYTVTQGKLYHEIKATMDNDNYASIIDFGIAPNYLVDGENYYSYDGHYFYKTEDLWLLLDDYQNGTRRNSVNEYEPFYDYYQFLSHRTITNISFDQVNDYFENHLGVHSTLTSYQDDDKDSTNDNLSQSQYYKQLESFWQYQYEFGANAMMMLALSANESALGRSSLSYTRNNLFGHAAYDSDVEANASRYFAIDHSVYGHTKYYISGSYSSPMKPQYHGSYFGNKASGMNVSYASDPYWGEKAAENYRTFDEQFGSIDENSYALAIKTSTDSIPIYKSPSEDSTIIYHTGANPDFAFVVKSVIQREEELWYEIQCDATLDDQHNMDLHYYYDFANQSAYIKASDIQYYNEGNQLVHQDFYTVRFDADGGHFYGDQDVISYQVPVGQKAAIVAPTKEKAIFSGWQPTIPDSLEKGEVFETKATYQEVSSIHMGTIPKQEYEINDRIDLEGGTLVMELPSQTMEIPLTTNMISGYDFTVSGDQEVIVEYAGLQTSYPIHVSQELDDIRSSIRDQIYQLLDEYHENGSIPESKNDEILDLKMRIDEYMLPYLTQAQLRDFDTIVHQAMQGQIRYQIERNPYELQVSGLSVSIPLGDSFEKRKYLEDTYRIAMDRGISSHAQSILQVQSDQLEAEIEETFTVSLFKNYEDYSLERPLILSIKKPDSFEEGDIYTVLYYDEDRDSVLKCYTRQSASRIHFMTKGTGEYMLVSRKTSNIYIDEDPIESLNEETRSTDMEKYRVYVSIGSLILLVGLLIAWRMSNRRRKASAKKEIGEKANVVHEHDIVDELTQALELYETQIINIQDQEHSDDQ